MKQTTRNDDLVIHHLIPPSMCVFHTPNLSRLLLHMRRPVPRIRVPIDRDLNPDRLHHERAEQARHGRRAWLSLVVRVLVVVVVFVVAARVGGEEVPVNDDLGLLEVRGVVLCVVGGPLLGRRGVVGVAGTVRACSGVEGLGVAGAELAPPGSCVDRLLEGLGHVNVSIEDRQKQSNPCLEVLSKLRHF